MHNDIYDDIKRGKHVDEGLKFFIDDMIKKTAKSMNLFDPINGNPEDLLVALLK